MLYPATALGTSFRPSDFPWQPDDLRDFLLCPARGPRSYFAYMQLKRVLQQEIAVFGERQSGKTVLVSSFYGSMQEPEFMKESLFYLTADDTGLGLRLLKNYLGMKKDARAPKPTPRDFSTSYAFTLTTKSNGPKPSKSFDAVRLIWHDYPGEWWEEEEDEPATAQLRVATFKSLLGSDVAILLVDGQKLLDYAGEEERYLKLLFWSFRTGLLKLKKQLLEGGQPLVKFPRIWILAMSKADLLPEVDVFGFRDLVIGKAAEDLDELRKALMGFVESPNALAVGEDFIRLSSAKFEPDRIKVTERIGLDLVLPIAAMLPLERHLMWFQQKETTAKVAEGLVKGIAALAVAFIAKVKVGPIAVFVAWVGKRGLVVTMSALVALGVDQLEKMELEARANKDYMKAVLTRFDAGPEQGRGGSGTPEKQEEVTSSASRGLIMIW